MHLRMNFRDRLQISSWMVDIYITMGVVNYSKISRY